MKYLAALVLGAILALGFYEFPWLMTIVLVGTIALVALWMLLARMGRHVREKQQLSQWQRPKKFDRNLIVIGAGSGGLVTAYIAAAIKSKVTLIEKNRMGGDCLYTGCVPSKSLIRSAKFLHDAMRSQSLGIRRADTEHDFAEIMERVQRVIGAIEPHDSPERYQTLGVEPILGEARLINPFEVEVDGRRLTARNIVLATGSVPFVPPIEGIEQVDYLTSENLWELREQPKKLVVLGGGPIGSEMAQAFGRLGTEVTQIEKGDRILRKEDPEFSELIQKRFAAEGISVHTDTEAKAVARTNDGFELICDSRGEQKRFAFDQLLVALGRRAQPEGLGVEKLGIELEEDGTFKVNEYLQTSIPNIYACGDAIGLYQFTHSAAHEAWYCAVNALFGHLKRFPVDYSVLPWATFVDPEVARVGLNETEAKQRGIEYRVATYEMAELDRALAEEETEGLVKVITPEKGDQILGVTIAGSHAGDWIAEFVAAMKHRIGLNGILGTVHIYPTLAEANKFAAGRWKQATKPEGLLSWVERYHRWRL